MEKAIIKVLFFITKALAKMLSSDSIYKYEIQDLEDQVMELMEGNNERD